MTASLACLLACCFLGFLPSLSLTPLTLSISDKDVNKRSVPMKRVSEFDKRNKCLGRTCIANDAFSLGYFCDTSWEFNLNQVV